ncbi:MAG TPA: hypothetical protein VFG30_09280 [Polyangiales bacterium]|nr:hypothetical protein [Polyangiales bacterium]
MSAHVPPHSVGVAAGHPETHVPLEHIGVLASHWTPHLPQFVGAVTSVSQPSIGSSEQCAQPFAHEVALKTQTSPEHVTGPATLGSVVQSCPHAPQLLLSLGKHAPSHDSCPAGHPRSPWPPPCPARGLPLMPPVLVSALPPAPLEALPLRPALPLVPEPLPAVAVFCPFASPRPLAPAPACAPPSGSAPNELSVVPEASGMSSPAIGLPSGVQLATNQTQSTAKVLAAQAVVINHSTIAKTIRANRLRDARSTGPAA